MHHCPEVGPSRQNFVSIARIHDQDLLSQLELPLPVQHLCIDVLELAGHISGLG